MSSLKHTQILLLAGIFLGVFLELALMGVGIPQEVRYCWQVALSKPLSRVQLFCDPMDCSLPASSVHGILQTRILKWVVPTPGDLPNPRTKPRSPTWQADSYHLNHQGKPNSFIMTLFDLAIEFLKSWSLLAAIKS